MPTRPPRSDIYAIYGGNLHAMTKQLLDAGRAAEEVSPQAGIAIKPNLVVGRPASGGATTHPEIVAGIVEYFQDHGARDISIIEGSWVGDDTRRAFSACGYNDVAKRYGVPLHDLKSDKTTEVDSPAGKIQICRRALDADVLINVPVLKGHCQTRMTCALKNMKGCIPDSEKRRFHREGLDELIAGLGYALRPALAVVDGVCGDLDFEEGGNPVQADRLFLGWDPFLVDVMACRLMGLAPGEIGYLRLAAKWGMGDLDANPLRDLHELNRPGPAQPQASRKVASLASGVQADQACSACYANLIHALKRFEEKGGRGKRPGISIGQGWKGKTVAGLGVGACCSGAERHVPGCPPSAEEILAFLK